MVEQLTLNQLVEGSSPSRCTRFETGSKEPVFILPNEERVPRSLALLTAIWFIASTSALAQTAPDMADAATIAHQWVQAVADRDYSTAWALLSARSQRQIVSTIADSEKLDPSDVRARFDRADQTVVAGFWTSFRTASSVSSLATVSATVVSSDGDTALVQFNGYPRRWKCYREAGGWRVGLVETVGSS
jgi:hypothetical protein